ncbi:kinase-like domain-containing protein [Coniochaeta sp. 2T2.1]|nr:kinase-like domain-containing protein [Coniochaeta sp. 2T2.1]
MSHLQVRGADFSVTKAKALDDAKKMQASVKEECIKAGKEVPAYRLQELIGKGSFGRVYKATDLKSSRAVAVKIIDIEESDTLNPKLADTYSEFLKEINALKLLSAANAPNINHVLDVLPVGQSMWMVTEYCAGGSVSTLMKPTAPGGLQEKWIIPILREVALAIFWVHKHGVIHRDIKCANVLVTEDGRVQLCDFGVAGIIETKFDKRSTFIGTPNWMAPELFDPSSSYGTEVDIWAFGSMVYEIASGLPPNVVPGLDISQLGSYLKSHIPRLEGDQYSDELKDLVAFCLEEDPSKRPTIEAVQQHRYILNTEAAYPTSTLANLVKAYRLWEAQGGSRKSLFAMGGAQGPSEYSSTALANDEWNFSSTIDFDRSVLEDTDAQAVYDVYGTNVDFEFNDETSRPTKPKGRRRPPPHLPAVKAPLEKVFDPNTISNYDENSRLYYNKPMPAPVSEVSDLPLRDDSMHSTLRESLIDLDASLHGSDLSRFADMDTIRGGPSQASNDYHVDDSDLNKPPLSDPADMKNNRRTQDWKFPSMAPPASANPEMSRFPFNEGGPNPLSAGRPPLLHTQTEPIAPPSSQSYELMVPRVQDNRVSVGSLIDLDESFAVPELTRPSTANSDVASVSGSEMGGTGNPFDLERHASLYNPFANLNANRAREPSIYVSDDSDFARLAKPPGSSDLPDFDTNGSSTTHSRQSSYDDGGYSAADYLDSEYLTMASARQSRARSTIQQQQHHQQQQQQQPQFQTPPPRSRNESNGNGNDDESDLPPVPAPPSARVMQGLGGRDEVREDMMRMLNSFAEHLSFANTHISSLPVRKGGRQGGDSDASQ